MMRKTRRRFSSRFKAQVAISAVRGEETLEELSDKYGVHRNQIQQWRNILIQGAERIFEKRSERARENTSEKIRELHAKIGELTMERDWLFRVVKGRSKGGSPEK